jgi:hypothetical protein
VADDYLNWDFLHTAADRLKSWLPEAPSFDCLKLIEVALERGGQRLQVLMDGEKALAFFAKEEG